MYVHKYISIRGRGVGLLSNQILKFPRIWNHGAALQQPETRDKERVILMVHNHATLVLLLLVSCIASAHAFLSPKPSTTYICTRRETKLSAMTPPAAEGSVDAQALEIIKEIEAGSMTM